MQPLLYKSVLEDVPGTLGRLHLVPGQDVTLRLINRDATRRDVGIFILRSARFLGIWPARIVRLGVLREDHASVITPALERGERLRARIVAINGPAYAPHGVAVSVWASGAVQLSGTRTRVDSWDRPARRMPVTRRAETA